MRVLVNTPSPQGSTGITTNLFPSMTLGCGAMAGNSTSDNVGPLNLINVKRLAYTVRQPQEAFESPLDGGQVSAGATLSSVDRGAVVSAVERYLASRGIAAAPSCGCPTPQPSASTVDSLAAEVVDRFLGRRIEAAPTPPPVKAVEFVCEADVREAIKENRKIYTGPKTIVTPSARDLAGPSNILVPVQG
jgi:hypothetical protein